jgi:hypothetical protein
MARKPCQSCRSALNDFKWRPADRSRAIHGIGDNLENMPLGSPVAGSFDS